MQWSTCCFQWSGRYTLRLMSRRIGITLPLDLFRIRREKRAVIASRRHRRHYRWNRRNRQRDRRDSGGSSVLCDRVFIVDLNQMSFTEVGSAREPTKSASPRASPPKSRTRYPAACTTAFDVFVPGTAAEHGAWKQFNAMFSRDTGRGYLSLQYQDADGRRRDRQYLRLRQLRPRCDRRNHDARLAAYTLQTR